MTLSHQRNILQSLSTLLSTRHNIHTTVDWFQTFCEDETKANASKICP